MAESDRRVHDVELERCHSDAQAELERLVHVTPQPERARRRSKALDSITAWAKELAPPPPTPRPA
jgi:hypothetical protein